MIRTGRHNRDERAKLQSVKFRGKIKNIRQTRFARGFALFLSALLLGLSFGATSADFHHALHGDQSQSNEHTCILALIRDGGIDFWSDPDLTVDRVGTFEFLELGLADNAPSYVRPRLLPWASGPPLIG